MATDTDKSSKSLALELFLLSAVALFIELLAIRWMSADFRAFSVFKTFPLVTFFVGLGVGFSKGKDASFRYTPLAVLLFTVLMKMCDLPQFGRFMLPSVRSYNWQQLLRDEFAYVLVFSILMVTLLSGPFLVAMCIGSRLGTIFNAMKPLTAYCFNIGGSIAGSLAFVLCCFFGLSPGMLLIPPAVIILLYSPGKEPFKWRSAVPFILALATALIIVPLKPGGQTFWSPYQRLDLLPDPLVVALEEPEGSVTIDGYELRANRFGYQLAYDLTPAAIEAKHIPLKEVDIQARWMLPYQFGKTGDVLVVGSGMGSDVAQALAFGADSVDAVDIDPTIISIGRRFHPLKPYASDKVRVICDDARHYFSHTDKKYDLVVFSHLDSHTVTGISSSVRLDNYVYTKESIKEAMKLLKPDGMLVLSFCTAREWFAERLFKTVTAAAGYEPRAFRDNVAKHTPNTVLIVGKAVEEGKPITLSPGFAAYLKPYHPEKSTSSLTLLTDDWPYLYLGPGSFDYLYLFIVLEIVLLSVFAGRSFLFSAPSGVNWQLFFLGAAFMLLELQFISRLALLYGATWLTSAVVINGVLIMILLANLAVIRYRPFFKQKMALMYALLFVSLAASYLLPVSDLLASHGGPSAVTYGVISLVTFLPILFAAWVFALAFDRIGNPGRGLAFNLLGAVLGALLEYLSNYTGINNLLLVAAGLYLFSAVFAAAAGVKPQEGAAGPQE